MATNRQVILYIAMSLDGYIATQDDDLSFLDAVAQDGQDYGYGEFIQSVDTVIVGRRTYDKVRALGVEAPHSDKNCYVITRAPQAQVGSTQFHTGDLVALIHQCKAEPGQSIFVDGGAEVVHQLMAHQLIDQFIISIVPVLLGSGIALFKPGRPTTPLQLLRSTAFDSGLVQLHYATQHPK